MGLVLRLLLVPPPLLDLGKEIRFGQKKQHFELLSLMRQNYYTSMEILKEETHFISVNLQLSRKLHRCYFYQTLSIA